MSEPRSIMDLLQEVTKIAEMDLDTNVVQNLKQNMRNHPLHSAVQSVLADHKEKIAISTRMIKDTEVERNDDRLDTMLRAEGITGPEINPTIGHEIQGNDQNEYRQQLRKLRAEFEGDMMLCQKNRFEWTSNVKKVLEAQGEFRPISENTINKMVTNMSDRFGKVSELLKQSTCENLIQLRKRYFDARRKRRNFSKSSTEILNEYFQAHLNHPYPSEETKQALAIQCNISVAQVSNWFGNKRIRYKKTMSKNQETEPPRKKASVPPNPYVLFPNPLNGMVNPYQMMMPPPMPFNFPICNPEMMSHYQQSIQNTTQPL